MLGGSDRADIGKALLRYFHATGDQRIRDLEGRGRQSRLPGTNRIAGDHQVVIDLIADEAAHRSLVGKLPRQILANLAAPGRDIGKAARRRENNGGKQTERMAAMDHGSILVTPAAWPDG
jgi:hypothetical protein